MDVLDQEDDRTARFAAYEGSVDRIEERPTGQLTGRRTGVAFECEALDECVRRSVPVCGATSLELREQVAERSKRRLDEFNASREGDRGTAPGEPGLEMTEQARLPDAGLAPDQHDATAPVSRFAAMPDQETALSLASYEHVAHVGDHRLHLQGMTPIPPGHDCARSPWACTQLIVAERGARRWQEQV
jgi:hypothetical protein